VAEAACFARSTIVQRTIIIVDSDRHHRACGAGGRIGLRRRGPGIVLSRCEVAPTHSADEQQRRGAQRKLIPPGGSPQSICSSHESRIKKAHSRHNEIQRRRSRAQIAERFGVNPGTVQRISRPFAGSRNIDRVLPSKNDRSRRPSAPALRKGGTARIFNVNPWGRWATLVLGPHRDADWAAGSINCTHLVVRTWPHTGSRCDLRWGRTHPDRLHIDADPGLCVGADGAADWRQRHQLPRSKAGGRTDDKISRRTNIPALGQGSADLAIACWTKLEITPPSISNHSRYGTRRAGTSVSRSPKIRHEGIVLTHVMRFSHTWTSMAITLLRFPLE
jgi:hypothetical protein